MNYSGPSSLALFTRELEAERDYDLAREAFEQMVEFDQEAAGEWMANGGWVDNTAVISALYEAREAGCEKARDVLCGMGHEYARFKV